MIKKLEIDPNRIKRLTDQGKITFYNAQIVINNIESLSNNDIKTVVEYL